MTPDTGQLRPTEIYKSQVLTAWRRIPHTVQGHRRVAFGNRVNNQELWRAGFIATIGCVLSGGQRRVWLACLNNSAGHQGTEIATPGEAKAAPGLLIRRVVWLGEHFLRAGWGGEPVPRPFEDFPILPDVKAGHNIRP